MKMKKRCKFCKKKRRNAPKNGLPWKSFDGAAMCPVCIVNKFGAFI